MYKIANAVRNALINKIEANGSVFQGHLKNSVKVTFKGTTLYISVIGYGKDIEFGTPPGTYVSIEELKDWCRLKLGDENAAYAVAKKILNEGIDPKPFIRPVIDTELKQIVRKYVT